MLYNHLKFAWRNLKQNRAYALINIFGLSLGIASGIIIFSLIDFQLHFDNFHRGTDRIHRIVSELHNDKITYVAAVPSPFGKAFQNDYSFAEQVARLSNFSDQIISLPNETTLKNYKDENNVVYADPSFFSIFNFPPIYGNIEKSFTQPFTALVTRRLAERYFGTADAIGKIIRLNNETNYTIVGILKNKPLNTDFKQEIYLSYASLQDSQDNWAAIYGGMQVFVKLKQGISPQVVNQALVGLSRKYYSADEAKIHQFKLQPLADIHFNERLGNPGAKRYLWALALVGLLLILTSCVNFVNLATAQSVNRAREVGLKKILGSSRIQLFWQFILETAIVTFMALMLVNVLANLTITALNIYLDIQIPATFINNWRFAFFAALTFLLMVALSGCYPAIVMTGIQPLKSLQSSLSTGQGHTSILRRSLIIVQVMIAQILIISTLIIAQQINFSTNSDLGFDQHDVLMLPIPSTDEVKMNTLRTQLAAIPAVREVSFCYAAPASGSNMTTGVQYANRNEAEAWGINMKYADNHFLSVFNIPLVAGRNVFPADTTREFLVNETFVKKLGITRAEEVIGKNLRINGGTISAPIVGVVKDFHNYSLRDEISPICILSDKDGYPSCAVKLHPDNMTNTLDIIKKIWMETYPDNLYSFTFLTDRIARFYQTDKMILLLIQIFTCVAIFVSCMGLYGMISFMAFRKTKEIGIRKVLGATVNNILWIFGREFGKLLLLACCIAAPLAYWAMHLYLQGFRYRIPIQASTFILALLATSAIVTVTICYRAIKAALANPAASLRTE